MLQFWLNPLCQGAELLQAVQDMSDEEEEGGKEDKRYSRKQENSSYPEPSNEEATTSSAQYTQVLPHELTGTLNHKSWWSLFLLYYILLFLPVIYIWNWFR